MLLIGQYVGYPAPDTSKYAFRPYMQTGKIKTIMSDLLMYPMDTEEGMSGGPVYSTKNEATAIIHGGFSSLNNQACRVVQNTLIAANWAISNFG